MIDDYSAGDDISAAGGSAQAEFERRADKHRAKVADHRSRLIGVVAIGLGAAMVTAFYSPPIGFIVMTAVLSLVARFVFVPNTTAAWSTGAKGERQTAAALEKLKMEGFVILHDRRIPGSSANIDHVVIGPPGVAIVETKSYRGKLRVKGNDVYVGGYRKTSQTVEEARREALAVTVALADALERSGVKVRPILCVHRADLPFFDKSPQGVSIVNGRGLVKTLRKAPPRLAPHEVRELAALASDRLRPASGPAPRLYTEIAPARVAVPPPPAAVEGDERFLPPIRREQLRLAREARARVTDERTYWTRGGLAEGKAAPIVPPGEAERQ